MKDLLITIASIVLFAFLIAVFYMSVGSIFALMAATEPLIEQIEDSDDEYQQMIISNSDTI